MIQYDGEHVDGSPFTVRVYDPGHVRVAGTRSGVVGTPVVFNSKNINAVAILYPHAAIQIDNDNNSINN